MSRAGQVSTIANSCQVPSTLSTGASLDRPGWWRIPPSSFGAARPRRCATGTSRLVGWASDGFCAGFRGSCTVADPGFALRARALAPRAWAAVVREALLMADGHLEGRASCRLGQVEEAAGQGSARKAEFPSAGGGRGTRTAIRCGLVPTRTLHRAGGLRGWRGRRWCGCRRGG
jgi:hypothetical protein